jgi:hypothetical protein
MNFVVLLAHFVGWVVTIPILVYLIVSSVVALYALIFWYDTTKMFPIHKKDYSLHVGYKNLWKWIFALILFLITRYTVWYHLRKGYSFEEIRDKYDKNFSSDEVREIIEISIFHSVPFFSIREYDLELWHLL